MCIRDSPNMSLSEFASGINNFQFYTCEINPHNPNIVLGGAQDNGTNVQVEGLLIGNQYLEVMDLL